MWKLNDVMTIFEALKFQPINIHMDNGDILTLTPYTYHMKKKTRYNIDYIVVEGSINPWLSGVPEKVIDNLNNYEDRVKEAEKEIEELKNFYMETTNDDTIPLNDADYEVIKEWHKVAYGYKPEKQLAFL